MTVLEMHQWFDLIQDKVDEVYFTESEKDMFINRAIQIFINDVVNAFLLNPQTGQVVISSLLEDTLNAAEVLRPLMVLDMSVTADASGIITVDAIDAAIKTATGEEDTFLHILNLANSNGIGLKYVRENDYYKFAVNDFKKATTTYPQYRISHKGIHVTPIDSGGYKLSVIKEPVKVNFDAQISTDLPETTHDYIMAIALELAGLSSKDEALLQMRNVA